ncbi:MAG: hypothetical protein R3B57_06170 [Phycisphaerales bacterium]
MDDAEQEIPGVEFVLILLLCVAASIVYGVLHDQVTARVCIEYFTVTHPPLVASDSPTVVGLAWGVVATWWMGIFLGVPLAMAARLGPRPRRSARQMAPPIVILLIVMGVLALIAGLVGYWVSATGRFAIPPDIAEVAPEAMHDRWMGDWFAHNMSYEAGFFGAIVLMALTILWRWRDWRRARASDRTARTARRAHHLASSAQGPGTPGPARTA